MDPPSNTLIQTADEPYTPNACYMLRPAYPKSQTHGINIHIQNQPSAQTVGSSTMFNDVKDVSYRFIKPSNVFVRPYTST